MSLFLSKQFVNYLISPVHFNGEQMYELHWLSENYDENELYFEFWAQQNYVYTLGQDPRHLLHCCLWPTWIVRWYPNRWGVRMLWITLANRDIQSCPTYRLQDDPDMGWSRLRLHGQGFGFLDFCEPGFGFGFVIFKGFGFGFMAYQSFDFATNQIWGTWIRIRIRIRDAQIHIWFSTNSLASASAS